MPESVPEWKSCKNTGFLDLLINNKDNPVKMMHLRRNFAELQHKWRKLLQLRSIYYMLPHSGSSSEEPPRSCTGSAPPPAACSITSAAHGLLVPGTA